jgi:hypothetical protein
MPHYTITELLQTPQIRPLANFIHVARLYAVVIDHLLVLLLSVEIAAFDLAMASAMLTNPSDMRLLFISWLSDYLIARDYASCI